MESFKDERSNNMRTFHLYRDFFKRFCDIIFSIIAIVILVIPMLIIALIIKITSPKEPAFFVRLVLAEYVTSNGHYQYINYFHCHW